MSSPNKSSDLNYSLGILLAILILFWFMCYMNSGGYNTYYEDENSFTQGCNMKRNYNDVLQVPNSNTSMRKYIDEVDYKYKTLHNSSEMDDRQVEMHLSKQVDGTGPRSLTSTCLLQTQSGFNMS